jgi:glycosyltransferase involved in cell wall biosynthesis
MRRVQALRPLNAKGIPHRTGDVFILPAGTAKHLATTTPPLVRLLADHALTSPHDPNSWTRFDGRELRVCADESPAHWYVVVCLNIWNDRPALERTMPSWLPYVDRVIVVDGAYGTKTPKPSTDGLLAYLKKVEPVKGETFIICNGAWPDQCAKRTRYFGIGEELVAEIGPRPVLLFVVDADETVTGAEKLRRLPLFDVGWVELNNPTIYRRTYGQPRLFRAQAELEYRGRHHWVYSGEHLLATHQYGGRGWLHRWASGVALANDRHARPAVRKAAKQTHVKTQLQAEVMAVAEPGRTDKSDAPSGAREALRILQFAPYDPGMVAYRLHTGINTTTPHASVMVRKSSGVTFGNPTQFDAAVDPAFMNSLLGVADVAHCHLDYGLLHASKAKKLPRWTVIHHHGSMFRKMLSYFSVADVRADLRLVSNLELLRYGDGLKWLPNPMPVAEYRTLRSRMAYTPNGTFRVGHSPSKPEIKGTFEFVAACERLQASGVKVEPVLMHGVTHREAMNMKATCDAFFDSFDLGIQCSGLEAGAMGIPVLAGDDFVRQQYEQHVGSVPYVFVRDGADLEAQLARLVHDEGHRERCAVVVRQYVTDWHDEAAVALRYLDLLDEAVHWRQALRVGRLSA